MKEWFKEMKDELREGLKSIREEIIEVLREQEESVRRKG